MATNRPFGPGDKGYIAKLNDLYYSGLPSIRVDPDDPESDQTNVDGARVLEFGDSGHVADVVASAALTFDVSCMRDGWSMVVNVVAGTATLSTVSVGSTFMDGSTSKSITAGNAALISCDGTQFRFFRHVAT